MMPLIRKVSHEERLDVARQISTLILEKYGESVLAVFVIGSVAKKLERPYSDLEMICVVRDGVEVLSKKYVYKGLVIDFDYPQESSFLKEARETRLEWPLAADQFRNRIVLFERDGWFERLDEAVAQNDRTDMAEPLRVAAVALSEGLASVRNARLKEDPWDLRTRAFYMAWDAARVVFVLNGRYVLTTSWLWKQALECPVKPDNFAEMVQILLGMKMADADEVVQAAERLYEEMMKIVSSRRVSIEVEDLYV
jgi:kanamycin nucleotidyltransferase